MGTDSHIWESQLVPRGTPPDINFWIPNAKQHGQRGTFAPELCEKEEVFYYSEGDSDTSEEHSQIWQCIACGGEWWSTGREEMEEQREEHCNNVNDRR